MDTTVEEMLTDIWAHRFKEDPKLLNDLVEDDDFDAASVAAEIGVPDGAQEMDLPPDDDFEDL